MKTFLATLLLFPLIAAAELSFPLDDITGDWVLINRTTCQTVGPVPRAFPCSDDGEFCFGPEFALLRYTPAPPQPDYDGNLRRLEQPYLMCGPDTGTCYDTTFVHNDGVGCSATDQYQQVSVLVNLGEAERRRNLANRATEALNSHYTDADFRRDLMLLMRGLAVKTNNQDLPTEPFDFDGVFNSAVSRMAGAVDPNVTRYFNLLERINAGTIQDGEIKEGWTEQ